MGGRVAGFDGDLGVHGRERLAEPLLELLGFFGEAAGDARELVAVALLQRPDQAVERLGGADGHAHRADGVLGRLLGQRLLDAAGQLVEGLGGRLLGAARVLGVARGEVVQLAAGRAGVGCKLGLDVAQAALELAVHAAELGLHLGVGRAEHARELLGPGGGASIEHRRDARVGLLDAFGRLNHALLHGRGRGMGELLGGDDLQIGGVAGRLELLGLLGVELAHHLSELLLNLGDGLAAGQVGRVDGLLARGLELGDCPFALSVDVLVELLGGATGGVSILGQPLFGLLGLIFGRLAQLLLVALGGLFGGLFGGVDPAAREMAVPEAVHLAAAALGVALAATLVGCRVGVALGGGLGADLVADLVVALLGLGIDLVELLVGVIPQLGDAGFLGRVGGIHLGQRCGRRGLDGGRGHGVGRLDTLG